MARKVLILADSAGESFEVLYARTRFREAGFQAVITAPHKKILETVIQDFYPGWNTYKERPGYLIEADVAVARARPADYEALVVTGGRAVEGLRQDKRVTKLIQEFNQGGKWILALGQGVLLLFAAGLGAGRRMTSHRLLRADLQRVGGVYVDEPSVVDGNLITAQTWESSPEFYRNIFANLK